MGSEPIQANPADNSQPYDAPSILSVCGPSSPIVHSPPPLLQEQIGEIPSQLGYTSTTGPSVDSGIDLVVPQPIQGVWSIPHPNMPTGDDLCGREQHWLGLRMESANNTRLLDDEGSRSIHQLERADGSLVGDSSLPISPGHQDLNPYRQSYESGLYQQPRRNSITSSPQLSSGSLELVSESQHHFSSTTHSRHNSVNIEPATTMSITAEETFNRIIQVSCNSLL